MNLLESAGFSRSNPYYVVQQGKVFSWFPLPMIWCLHDLNLLNYIIFYTDSITNLDERLWAIGSAEGNWWHPSLWGETSWKSENYARNWWVTFLKFCFLYIQFVPGKHIWRYVCIHTCTHVYIYMYVYNIFIYSWYNIFIYFFAIEAWLNGGGCVCVRCPRSKYRVCYSVLA